MKQTQKLALAGLWVALGVALSPVYIPVGTAKCFPLQHLINVLTAVILGPYYSLACAFLISLLRNILGLGSLLAFPGSMIGALLSGLLYRRFGRCRFAAAGELIGTGVIGGLLSAPIAVWLMGKEVGFTFFILPFMISSLGGTAFALVLLNVPQIKTFIKTRRAPAE